MKQLADQVKVGNDQLYETNHADINAYYDRANEALQKSLVSKQEMALIEQEIRDSKLINIQLEE